MKLLISCIISDYLWCGMLVRFSNYICKLELLGILQIIACGIYFVELVLLLCICLVCYMLL